MKGKRKSYGHVRHATIYPVIGSKRTTDDLKTVAMIITPEKATALARMLLNAAHDGGVIAITGFRNIGHVTVTSTKGRGTTNGFDDEKTKQVAHSYQADQTASQP